MSINVLATIKFSGGKVKKTFPPRRHPTLPAYLAITLFTAPSKRRQGWKLTGRKRKGA